ncbi:hypothetical protein THAOC_00533 [Thalassiosira oceanica]|uniref:Uncharacterized protein n=1 Tax=Thalassiosira oceanica TaxID=159749 RepID=K0TRD8_THAOC|nr:hypothetical protein THAOC_00533 [Thalassiosira oceanica]|eukprot:EJK77622.1 hypothetical protein THAOC_00533 [Thalassiosira oceanica]
MKEQQEERRKRNSALRLDPSSTVPKTHLTSDELKTVTKKMNTGRKAAKAMIARLRKKLVETEQLLNASEEVVKTMQAAVDEANARPKEFRESLKESLEEMIREQAKDDDELDFSELMSEQTTNELLDFIQQAMKNHSIKAVGKNNFEYSPKLMGLAMSQYLRGPTAYMHWREESPVIIPHPDTMRHKKEKMNVRDGDCVAQYERISLDLNVLESSAKKWSNLQGEVIMDEMHLQGDVILNSSGNRTIGFSNDFVCRKKILKSLLDQNEVPNHHLPAVKVNQWMFRSVNGVVYLLEFWYNPELLNGNELLMQFGQIVMRLEMVGVRVIGLVSDAGSNNSRMFRLLRSRLEVGNKEGAWLPIDRIRTPNIYDRSRHIYLFNCTTHGLKATRNQLYGSYSGGKGCKAFLSIDGFGIHNAILKESYERDKRRASKRTRLDEASIDPDSWSKMNVSPAMIASEFKTLAEISEHLYSELAITSQQRLTPDRFKIDGKKGRHHPVIISSNEARSKSTAASSSPVDQH